MTVSAVPGARYQTPVLLAWLKLRARLKLPDVFYAVPYLTDRKLPPPPGGAVVSTSHTRCRDPFSASGSFLPKVR